MHEGFFIQEKGVCFLELECWFGICKNVRNKIEEDLSFILYHLFCMMQISYSSPISERLVTIVLNQFLFRSSYIMKFQCISQMLSNVDLTLSLTDTQIVHMNLGPTWPSG